jgi:hypothetical protein
MQQALSDAAGEQVANWRGHVREGARGQEGYEVIRDSWLAEGCVAATYIKVCDWGRFEHGKSGVYAGG